MQSSAQDNHDFEMSLRDQLIAAQNGQPPPAAQPAAQGADQHYPPPPPHQQQQQQQQQQPRPHEHHPHLDPAIGGHHMSPYAMPPNDTVSDGQDGSPASKKAAAKAQRELSTTKRAAQNRAAQRAFRQRKEQYIAKLEEEVKNFRDVEEGARTLQSENATLRKYVTELQEKLSEAKIPFPPAPRATRVTLPDLGDRYSRVVLPQEANLIAEHAVRSEAPLADLRARYAAPVSPEDQRYHADVQQEGNRPYRDQPRQHEVGGQHQQHQHQQYQPPVAEHSPAQRSAADHQAQPHSSPTSTTTATASEAALPPGAIDQLRAAAAQAGELDNARSSRDSGMPEGYTPANDLPPLKRPRLEEAESRGTAAVGAS